MLNLEVDGKAVAVPNGSTVMDAALMLQVIAGYDPQDPGSTDLPVPDYVATIAASTGERRVGSSIRVMRRSPW